MLPVGLASWVWFVLLAVAVYASMRIVGVRDWRCLVLAVTTPVIVHGLYYGNLTVLLLVPSRSRGATASGRQWQASPSVWQCREAVRLAPRRVAARDAALSRSRVGDRIVGRARPRRMGGDRVRRAARLPFAPPRGAGRVRGAERLALTVVGALGAPVGAAVPSRPGRPGCIAAAAWLVRGDDGDRRAFTVLVAASILASAIVWPNYLALLVPVAITWPRLAPAWFFGYVVWFAGAISPKATFRATSVPTAGRDPHGVEARATASPSHGSRPRRWQW